MTRRYRILYHHRIRAEDGQAMHVRELIRALREEGHEVHECALVPKGDTEGGSNAEPVGGFWQRVRLPRVATEVMEIAYNRTAMRMLESACDRFRPDFIYERHALHLFAGLRVARRRRLRLLLEVNSPMVDEMTRLRLLHFRRRAARVEREVLGGADRVFPVTAVLRDWLVRCGADPAACRVVPNGADPARYGDTTRAEAAALRRSRGVPATAPVIGFVGYMRDWHRLDFAVDALGLPGMDQVHLCLVGEGPALPSVVGRAQQLSVGDRVHVFPAVPPREVPKHVSMFDVGMIPAINPYSSPLKLFDYFAAGVAAIAPDQPNVRESVTDAENGILFAADDGDAFGSRLAAALGDLDRTRAIGRAGLDRLLERDWTWRGNARRVVAAYEELAR
ncbi:MAG: glycosyltransferase family 4 protein [Planctomycetes bacterium]|nr:glycosyltransferase family 4 protein [Planctomycetota bacterium]